ncbi:hypothetical protein Vadar_022038 [Vaccinium darrowii]|uniref:Uncharacterized protein n=1 Tax=Vaccinium darrowii TaxID=229202 RepID=A0ACB7Y8U9_9ERIC|nr:hypothetical protein Vadar_022038 [Vaccinium darrowii]
MDYHTVQTEKAKAMMRYRQLRNAGKMWRVLEIIVALAFFSWSSTRLPFFLNLGAQSLIRIYEYLINPHINFVVGNAIIVIVVLLSRQKPAANTTATTAAADVFDQYVPDSEPLSGELFQTLPRNLATVAEILETDTDTGCIDKQIVVTESAVRGVQCDAVSTAIDEGEKVMRRSFERTKSDNTMKREFQSAPGRILRRSETVVLSREERAITSLDTVDRLSNEEFRRTIEDVIAKHRRFLWAQRLNENDQ